MTLRFIDGMQHYSLPSQLNVKYTAVNNSNMATMSGRRSSTTAILMKSSGDAFTATIDTQQQWTIGFALYLVGGAESNPILQAIDSGGSNQLCVQITSGNNIALMRGASTGTVLATSTLALPTGTWNYIEVKMKVASSGGIFEVRVNETVWVTFSGNTQNTGNANAASFKWMGRFAQNAFMDIYVCDSNGSINNGYLGDCRVDTIRPASAGNYAQCTPQGSGSNYANVNETTPDNDTSYNTSNTAGNIDSFVFGSLTSITGTIFGVQANVDADKDDAGSRSIAAMTRVSSTDYVGSTQSVSTTYHIYTQIWEQNPNTSANWTATSINASEFGYKVIS